MSWLRKVATAGTAAIAMMSIATSPASAAPDTWNNQGQEVGGCPENFVYSIPFSAMSIPDTPTNNHNVPITGQISSILGSRDDTVGRSVPYNAQWLSGTISYHDSVADGTNATIKLAEKDLERCPSAKVHFMGLSEGADVAGYVFERIVEGKTKISPEQVGSVVRMSAPSRQSQGTQSWGTAKDGGGFRDPVNFGKYGDKVLEMCNIGDTICDTDRYTSNAAGIVEYIADKPLTQEGLQTAMDNASKQMDPQNLTAGIVEAPYFMAGWVYHFVSYLTSVPDVIGFMEPRMK